MSTEIRMPQLASDKPETDAIPEAERVGPTALARRLAQDAGLDVAELVGSGAHGRVTKRDVEQAARQEGRLENIESAQGAPEITTVARAADHPIAHAYCLSAECEIDALLQASRRLSAASPAQPITVNDLVIRAAALALREVPEANSSWDEDAIVSHESVGIAIAVASRTGLVTPIVHQADRKGLAALSAEIRQLAQLSREGEIEPTQYRDARFCVADLGMYGIDSVYAVTEPPTTCLLGVGSAVRRPVVRNEEIAIGTLMTLSLSADHRVLNAALGARLLAAIKQRIEQPLDMLF